MGVSTFKRWLGLLVAAIALCGVSWIGVQAHRARTNAVPHRARRAGRPIPVRTHLVTERPIEQVIGATAVTVPSETASIWVGSGLGLRDTCVTIRAVHVVEGQEVDPGQLLFELDDELFAQAVKRQETALAAAQAELQSFRQLHEERAATGIQLRNAELRVELAQLDLDVARRDLERCLVRSPIGGFVDAVGAVLGEQVDASRELTQVHRLDPIHVRVDFPQERIDDVFVHQEAELVLDSFPQETFQGEVVRIAPQVDPETRVLPVVLQIDNPQNRIKAGITGYARLKVRRTATIVPASAVIRRGGKAMVFRVEGGRAHIRHVLVGPQAEIGMLEVRDGLASGDEVVVYGTEFLQENDPVDDKWREWARRG
jgi:RND family efflux transporter MFP subunit